MKLVFILFASGMLLEVFLYVVPFLWRFKRVLAAPILIVNGFAAGALFMFWPNTISLLLLLITLYRLFNVLRTFKGRMHEKYLKNTTRRTGLRLMALQLILGGAWLAWMTSPANRRITWLALAVIQVLAAVVLLASTIRRMQHTRPVQARKHFSDIELPTLSVAIPARNETQDLEECLLTLVGSNYPKLEILVLDDCSQNKRTPEIIRSFAHDGVRFIQGELPKDTWLPKNQAYDRLAQEANGEYVLFCGVDMRFDPDSLRKIMGVMVARKKQMMSILPSRSRSASQSTLLQAMRYWWELVPPRRLFRRPPVISSTWIISKKALTMSGGFAAVSRSIVPEAFFAKNLIAHDGYSFVRSNDILGLVSVKSPEEQRDTAIRMRYPQLHRRPEQVFLVALAEFSLLVLPFVTAVSGWWLPISSLTHVLAVFASVLLTITYVRVALATRVNSLPTALFVEPFVVLADIAVLHISMWQYEFSEVTWKGRNICIPVMHTYSHLPKVDEH